MIPKSIRSPAQIYGSQYGTDTDDNHQIKDIGTDDIADGKLVVAGK